MWMYFFVIFKKKFIESNLLVHGPTFLPTRGRFDVFSQNLTSVEYVQVWAGVQSDKRWVCVSASPECRQK